MKKLLFCCRIEWYAADEYFILSIMIWNTVLTDMMNQMPIFMDQMFPFYKVDIIKEGG